MGRYFGEGRGLLLSGFNTKLKNWRCFRGAVIFGGGALLSEFYGTDANATIWLAELLEYYQPIEISVNWPSALLSLFRASTFFEQNGRTRAFHNKVLCKYVSQRRFVADNEKYCVTIHGEKHLFFSRSITGGLREAKPLLHGHLNCKFSHLIIHVFLSPTRAERWRASLKPFYTKGTFSFFFPGLNQFVKNTIDSMRFSIETRQWQLIQKLCSEEREFAAHVDSVHNCDGGWCKFSTACEGNYQYLNCYRS